jgi:hypothetical protein
MDEPAEHHQRELVVIDVEQQHETAIRAEQNTKACCPCWQHTSKAKSQEEGGVHQYAHLFDGGSRAFPEPLALL